AEAAKKGYRGILSNGYYLDLIEPASRHYLNDPIPENTTLTPEEQKLILGGEATMWSEWVSPETIDSRIWPRTAAIAERFWSPREVKDVDDMYRRLAVVRVQLEDVGLLHKKNPEAMLRRLAGDLSGDEYVVETIKKLVDVIEPVKGYKRGSMQKATQFTPLTRLADVARPDSDAARELAKATTGLLYVDSGDRGDRVDRVSAMLTSWGYAGHSLPSIIEQSPIMDEALPLAKDLEEISEIGLEGIKYLNQRNAPSDEWRASRIARLEAAAIPKAAVEFAIIQPIKELVIAAAEQEKRKMMSAEEWKKHVKSLAAEKKKQ
ncbi:MAG TPA: family 20 glycosylhydrolase, partial [Blastocatellia bacterium]|nr:family 20 glycosylhydrolase [Blastocatellia bacterium]